MTSATKPTARTIDLATGLRYHMLEWDADSDHTVILVHGFLDLSWGWQAVVESGLAGKFHLVAPDMRGHGDSDRVGPGGYYYFMDYVADLADLADLVSRSRLSLVGHSMGGSICSYYAGSFPDRVTRLALLEGLGPPEETIDMPGRIRGWLNGWKRARQREPVSYANLDEAAARLCQHDRLLDPVLAEFLAERGTVATADGRYHFKHDPLHVTRGPYPYRIDMAASLWKNINCPVLLVEGSKSIFRHHAEQVERRYAYFPTGKRVVIDGAGHMMQRHRPAELARLLRDFLAE
ncbi:MAG: alpha/beta hydrolase [Proteobacteria bacterium]|nr:alpha/beta hydrolase [Pseudomonadota bacterium]